MMQQGLTPGVQHGKEADLGTQMLGIGGDGSQGLGRGPEENAIDHPLVLVSDSGNLFRHGEDDVKVLGLEDLGKTILNPVSASQRLALWAVPITAAVVEDALMATRIAPLDMTAESGGPAHLDSCHDAPLAQRQRSIMLLTIGCAVAAEDIRHFQFRTLHLRSVATPQGQRKQVERAGGGAHFAGGDAQIAGRGRQAAMAEQ